MQSFVSFFCWLLLLNIVANGYAETCLHCIAQGDERICDDAADMLECNADLAEKYLSLFIRVNDNLSVEGIDKTRFKCFKFSVTAEDFYHLKGCTYEALPICDKMKEHMDCTTCQGKDCNAMFYESYLDDEEGRADRLCPVSSVGLIGTCVLVISLFRFFALGR